VRRLNVDEPVKKVDKNKMKVGKRNLPVPVSLKYTEIKRKLLNRTICHLASLEISFS
jgi:hypothetical protein